MKMLIFLIVMTLVAAVVIFRVRKADAERDLARRETIKSKQKQRKEAITPENHTTWPVIIHPGGKGVVEEDVHPEPLMTSIEFEPVDRPSAQH